MPERQRDFIYLSGAPRSGTTYLLAVLNHSSRILMLNEFPIFDFLGRGPLYEALHQADKLVGQHSDIRESANTGDLRTLLDTFRTELLETVREPGFDPPARAYLAALHAKSTRWLGQTEHLFFKPRRLGPDQRAIDLDRLAFRLITDMAIARAESRKTAGSLDYFGVKLPDHFATSDIRRLRERVGAFRMISAFRDPMKVCLSSLQRMIDAAAGHDSWPIRSAHDAAASWVRNFYFQLHWAEQLGPAAYLPVFYETLDDEAAYHRIASFLDIPDITKLNFHDDAGANHLPTTRFAAELHELFTTMHIPHGAAWHALATAPDAATRLLALRPCIPHDHDRLDLAAADSPSICLGFWDSEPDGRWMVEPRATIEFAAPARWDGATLELALTCWGHAPGGIAITITLNDGPATLLRHTPDHPAPTTLALPELRPWNRLTFTLHDTEFPAESDPIALKLRHLIFSPPAAAI